MNEQIIPVHMEQSLLLLSKLQIKTKLCDRDLNNAKFKIRYQPISLSASNNNNKNSQNMYFHKAMKLVCYCCKFHVNKK